MPAYVKFKIGNNYALRANLWLLKQDQKRNQDQSCCLVGTINWKFMKFHKFLLAFTKKTFWLETTIFTKNTSIFLFLFFRKEKNQN